MNPKEALNAIREKRAEMLHAAQLMEERVSILKKLDRCFSEGYQWRFHYSIDETTGRVGGVRIVCAHSGAWTELHSTPQVGGDDVAEAGVIHITFNDVDYTLDEFFDDEKMEGDGEE